MHGLLSMDACVIDGPVRERNSLLIQRFVAPLVRAMAQVAVERDAPAAAAAMLSAASAAPAGQYYAAQSPPFLGP